MTHSLSRQDLFVMHMMGNKVGTYLEIGASHPIMINNTYLLELNGWTGTSIDISNECETIWNSTRKNKLIIADALNFNHIDTDRIDYLSMDIEPAHQTLQCMINLLSTGCRFSIITFEHDAYHDKLVRKLSRSILHNENYLLAVPDIQCEFGSYEDWYIDKTSDINLDLLNTWS